MMTNDLMVSDATSDHSLKVIVLDTDKTFRRILSVFFSIYLMLIVFIQLQEKTDRTPLSLPAPANEPARTARILTEKQKGMPPPESLPPLERTKVEPIPAEPVKQIPPKIDSPLIEAAKMGKPLPTPAGPPVTKTLAKADGLEKEAATRGLEKGSDTRQEAPAASLPKIPPAEEVKKVGLLGLLGGKGTGPSAGGDFTSLKSLPPPPAMTKAPSSFFSSSSSSASPSPSSSFPSIPSSPSLPREAMEKMRQQAVASQEERITETRRAVVQEDLSQTRIIQPEGTHRSQQVISDIVRRNVEKLHLLYTRQLQARPDLQGFATVEFVISSQGKVSSCRLVTSTLSDPVFEEAIVQEILRWQFPTAERGITTVLYPLSFLPAG